MKRVLILALTSDVGVYPMLMETARHTWDAREVPGVRTVYYSTGPGMKDGLTQMGHKNLWAFSEALKSDDWDFVARVNSSCYVCKQRLLDHVQKCRDTAFISGVLAPGEQGRHQYLWGGMQFIISRDVIQEMVRKQDKWNHSLMEDVAMSEMAESLGYVLDGGGGGCSINLQPNGTWLCIWYKDGGMGGFDFATPEQFAQKNISHFIRVKQDYDRSVDVKLMTGFYNAGV